MTHKTKVILAIIGWFLLAWFLITHWTQASMIKGTWPPTPTIVSTNLIQATSTSGLVPHCEMVWSIK